MTTHRLTYRGEVWITVAETARCYGVLVTEIESWVEAELVIRPSSVLGQTAFPAAELDRIATIIRHSRLLGLDILALQALLGHRDADRPAP
jgi:hypothetical protein